jgi:PTS system nitrogen regulatory IIA component
MEIEDLLLPRAVIAQLRAGNKKQVLLEIARRAAATTGLGRGLAIPHGKLPELDRLHGVFARLERPIPFDAFDRRPVDLVFALLAPADAGAEHLRALARVSRLLRDDAICQKLRGADNPDALYALLTDRSESHVA